MDRDSLKNLILQEMKKSIHGLRIAVETNSMLEVNYFEGKLNECINIYKEIFEDPVPEALWKQAIDVWDLVTEREEKEKSK